MSVRAVAYWTYDPFLQVSLNQRGKGLLVRPTHEYGAPILDRGIYRKLSPKVVQKLGGITPQDGWKIDVVDPVGLLARNHRSRLWQFQPVLRLRDALWTILADAGKKVIVLFVTHLFNFAHVV